MSAAFRRDEAGLTLVELLVVVAILGIIGAVVGESVVVGLKTTAGVDRRLGEGRDAELTASWFQGDVASASLVGTGATTCGTSPAVVTLQWADEGTLKVASYAVVSGELVRSYCESGGASPAGGVRTVSVATSLGSAAPSVACDGSAACAATARSVALTVPQASGSTFTVTGTRRASA